MERACDGRAASVLESQADASVDAERQAACDVAAAVEGGLEVDGSPLATTGHGPRAVADNSRCVAAGARPAGRKRIRDK